MSMVADDAGPRVDSMEHLRNEYAQALSGGQQKLLELGRLLIFAQQGNAAIASSTERVCSTLAPREASSSISS